MVETVWACLINVACQHQDRNIRGYCDNDEVINEMEIWGNSSIVNPPVHNRISSFIFDLVIGMLSQSIFGSCMHNRILLGKPNVSYISKHA